MKGGMRLERGEIAQKSALRIVAATTRSMHSGQDCGTIPYTAHLLYHILILIASIFSTFAIFLCMINFKQRTAQKLFTSSEKGSKNFETN
jgi:hypothetical protein